MPSPTVAAARPRLLLAFACLCACACLGLGWWWWQGRPVALPDAPSTRIACVSYAPFRHPGENPLSADETIGPARIDADLRALSSRFDCVRTYSQSHGLYAVPAIAARYHMKVLMGIWLGSDPQANQAELRSGIAQALAHPDVLRGVIVGNEVLLRGDLSEAQLRRDIDRVRAAVRVPVSYADVWEFWLRHPDLAGAVDFVTIHILPYWEDDPVPPDHAIAHVAQVYARVQAAFPGKPVMIGETGWPSAGRPRRDASASLVNEARYLRGFLRYAARTQVPYNVIEAFDQPWKRALEGTAGGYWGIFDADARPKFPLRGPVTNIPRWWLGWLAAGAGALGFVLVGVLGRRWRAATAGMLALAGLAAGSALAWQVRQMLLACRSPWEWAIALAATAAALLTALVLARAAAMPVAAPASARWRWARGGWLFALVYYDLLMVWDGRYRDFPLGLFALPAVAYAVLSLLRPAVRRPWLEERFLAVAGALLGVAVVVQEAGLNATAWLWLVLNLALAWPVWRDARRTPASADSAGSR